MVVGILIEYKLDQTHGTWSLICNTLHVWQMLVEVSRPITREGNKGKGYQGKERSQKPMVSSLFLRWFPKLSVFCLNSCWKQRRKGNLCSIDPERNCKIKGNRDYRWLRECMELVWSSSSSINKWDKELFWKCHYKGFCRWACDEDQWNKQGTFIRSSIPS